MRRWLLAIVLAGMTIGEIHADDVTVIHLRDRAVVARRQIVLRDVAEVSGGPESQRRMVAEIDIDDLPPTGKTRSCSRAQIAYRLRLAGIPAESFRIEGAESVILVPQRRPIAAAEVEEAGRRAVAQALPDARSTDIRLARPIVAHLPELAEDESASFEAVLATTIRGPGRVQVNVTIRVEGEHRLSLPVYFDIVGLPAAKLPDPTPAVRSGDVVRMSVTMGNLKITGTGEALQSGRIGDMIRVRNVDSKIVVTGRVNGPKSVIIETPEP
ncbi:MAG: flagellar basal body P-ring formation chaperone FlgA [Gemmataceae bacterium]|nr:flagellar basal body P-ring formation chaperone FlgA [Gemmataceae bacterium]